MFDQFILEVQNNPKLRKRLIMATALLILAIFLYSLWSRKQLQRYELKDTGLKSDLNFGHLEGSNKLYYYNGSAFLSRDIASNKDDVLYSGTRLPAPDKIFWAGSKGVLITFRSSFYYTSVEDKLRSMGKRIDSSTKQYTWYLDFASGNLYLVSNLPFKTNMVEYSEKDSSIYMVDDNSFIDSEGDGGPDLDSFNVNTFNKIQLASDLLITGAENLSKCPDSLNNSIVCIVALDREKPNNQNLYTVDKDGKLSTIFESSGILLPTNQSDKYLSIGESKSNNSETTEGADLHGLAQLVDVTNKTKVDLGFDVSGAGSAVSLGTDGSFYVLDNYLSGKTVKKKTPYYYRSGQISGNRVKSKSYEAKMDNMLFESLFINNAGYGNNGLSLMNDYDKNQVLFIKKDSVNVGISDKSQVEAAVDSCSSGTRSSDTQYFSDSRTFRVYFKDSPRLNQEISAFSECFNSKGLSLMGYNISYFITDPVSGRIVND